MNIILQSYLRELDRRRIQREISQSSGVFPFSIEKRQASVKSKSKLNDIFSYTDPTQISKQDDVPPFGKLIQDELYVRTHLEDKLACQRQHNGAASSMRLFSTTNPLMVQKSREIDTFPPYRKSISATVCDWPQLEKFEGHENVT